MSAYMIILFLFSRYRLWSIAKKRVQHTDRDENFWPYVETGSEYILLNLLSIAEEPTLYAWRGVCKVKSCGDCKNKSFKIIQKILWIFIHHVDVP